MKMHYSHQLAGQRIAQIVGTFVLVPLLGLVVVGIFMIKSEHLFEEKYHLHATLKQAYGLTPGDPVLISGIAIGQVKSVELNQAGLIDVNLQLLARYRDMVRADSVASLSKSGVFMGQNQVEVAMGDPAKPVLTDGAAIPFVQPTDYAAMLAEVRSDVKPVLESVQRTMLRVEEITKDVQQAVQTGGRVLGQVEQTTRELPGVMATVKQSVHQVEAATAALPEATVAVKRTLKNVDDIVGDVKATSASLPGIAAAAKEAVNNIKATTESIKAVSRDMPPMVRTAQSTLEDVNTIVKGAKRTFPVSTMVKNAEAAEPAARQANGLQSLRGDQLKQ
jgi:phospholipid/cholesterol/gamma-HCH transport system substrate-binding protein